MEHVLRGSRNTVIRWNSTHPEGRTDRSEVTLLAGKQRMTAVQLFLSGRIGAFGRHIHEYQDRLPFTAKLQFSVNELDNPPGDTRMVPADKRREGGTYPPGTRPRTTPPPAGGPSGKTETDLDHAGRHTP